jgi:hypothetical protein
MSNRKITALALFGGLLAVCFGGSLCYGADQKPEDIVAKYLDSLGTPQARAAAKSRVGQGAATFKMLVGGAGSLEGKGVFVSEGDKMQFMMKFPNNDYRGEQFIFDGKKLQVTASTSKQGRSTLGEFVYTQDAIVKDGLFGGELTTAFPLLNLEARKAKLSYDGEKTIDGQKVFDLRYKPKKSSDLEIHLYFDAETHRHVMTVYTLRVRPGMGYVDPQLSAAVPANAGPGGDVATGELMSPTGGVVTDTSETATARQQETRYRLEERFSDFKTVDGLTLPTRYKLHFSQELASGKTTVNEWDIAADQVMDNVNPDPRNFQVK